MRAAAAAVVAAWLTVPLCAAETLAGVALVIGQADYEHLTPLANPVNDARAIDDLLGGLGFDVTRLLNVDAQELGDEIEEFVDEAAEADVALIYYSGHGIEAGGENYLIPVDADQSKPLIAGENLIEVSALLRELEQRVPLIIVLLDACRTNPFPPGQHVEVPGGERSVVVSTEGLAGTRGEVIAAAADASQLGMVLGLAASPGRAALDGPLGGNSPYAAALLKHLSAGGYEFHDLMTIVAEEVYLETGGRQSPWVNASLRRFLVFGAPVVDSDPDEALIREGRRELLLNISTMPDAARAEVASLAVREKLPLDALYGMLQALGVDMTGADKDLREQIRRGAERLKQILQDPYGEFVSDPELTRLGGLVDRALAEGAVSAAEEFGRRLIARSRVLTAVINDKRLEIAASFARTAAAHDVGGHYDGAAKAYGEAYAQALGVNAELARTYRWREAEALRSRSLWDASVLPKAVAAFREVLGQTNREATEWGALQHGLGESLKRLGNDQDDPIALAKAVEALKQSIAVIDSGAGTAWVLRQENLAEALESLALRRVEDAPTLLRQAVAARRNSLIGWKNLEYPDFWPITHFHLAEALGDLAGYESGTALYDEAAAAYRAVLATGPADPSSYRNVLWQRSWIELIRALMAAGTRETGTAHLEEALRVLDELQLHDAIDELILDWAIGTRGRALVLIGERQGSRERLEAGRAEMLRGLEAGYNDPDELLAEISRVDALLATVPNR